MFSLKWARGVATVALVAVPTLTAAEIVISDPYARVSRPNAPTGAAFMMIQNTGDAADKLLSVASDVAKRVELHTHIDQGDGIMKMTQIEGGIALPAGATHMMQRGGDHVMFMGLTENLQQGGEVTVILTFEQAGDIVVAIPVDNERQPNHGAMRHGKTDAEKTN